MDTNSDADVTECDGEKVVTMMDVLQEQQDFEDDANAVLGASDEKNCTYQKGYVKRQAIYACLTCCSEAKFNETKRAGVCLACSLNCHENHDLVELYTKRNFRCDCGNPKFNSSCQFTPSKTDLNEANSYNQNFSGVYCVCHRPYPDPEAVEEDEMIQCIICEDWLHSEHLEATVPSIEQYAEMVCKACMDKNEFLHDYSDFAVNTENLEVDIMSDNPEPSIVSVTTITNDIDMFNDSNTKPQEDTMVSVAKIENVNTITSSQENVETTDKAKVNTNNEEEINSTCDNKDSEQNKDDSENQETFANGIETNIEADKSDATNNEQDITEKDQIDATKANGSDAKDSDVLSNSEPEKSTDHEDMDDPKNNLAADAEPHTSEITEPQEEKSNESNIHSTVTDENDVLNEVESKPSEAENVFNEVQTEPSNAPSDLKITETTSTSLSMTQNISNDDVEPSTIDKVTDDVVPSAAVNGNSESTIDNKRKLEDLEETSAVKKVKIDETTRKAGCVRPKRGKVFRGASFWPSNFRQILCTCSECISMYKDLAVLYLTDAEDTVSAYETLGIERTNGSAVTQYEKGLEALSSLDRTQQINALTEYNNMRDKLLDFLKSFKDKKEVVKEEDIKAFFAGMKPKREPDGVYFCR